MNEKTSLMICIGIIILLGISLPLLTVHNFVNVNTNDFIFEGINDSNIAYNCYKKIGYVDCYVTPSTQDNNSICIGFGCPNNDMYFYRCYKKQCSIILSYKSTD